MPFDAEAGRLPAHCPQLQHNSIDCASAISRSTSQTPATVTGTTRSPGRRSGRAPARHRSSSADHAQKCNALSTADATVGTIPSSRNAGMKQTISGSTLRTPTLRAAAST